MDPRTSPWRPGVPVPGEPPKDQYSVIRKEIELHARVIALLFAVVALYVAWRSL